MATVVLDKGSFRFPLSELPMRVAVAACLAVEDVGVKASIKPPNDLVVDGKKIAGILCETFNQATLVGIGVNCLQTTFGGDLLDIACSILQVTGHEVNPIVLLPRILNRLKETLADEQWEEKLATRVIRKESRSATSSGGQPYEAQNRG
jgi:BirA family biotin operon repressor/biotin-[acetyl-CoA-carboxylase] ligase